MPVEVANSWNHLHMHMIGSGNGVPGFGLGGKMRSEHAKLLLNQAHNEMRQSELQMKMKLLPPLPPPPPPKKIPKEEQIKSMSQMECRNLIATLPNVSTAGKVDLMRTNLLCYFIPDKYKQK